MTKKGDVNLDMLKVRRLKVLEAFRFLKKHNSEYQDIEICEDNLDWMDGEDEQNLVVQNTVTLNDDSDDSDPEEDKGPCPKQAFGHSTNEDPTDENDNQVSKKIPSVNFFMMMNC